MAYNFRSTTVLHVLISISLVLICDTIVSPRIRLDIRRAPNTWCIRVETATAGSHHFPGHGTLELASAVAVLFLRRCACLFTQRTDCSDCTFYDLTLAFVCSFVRVRMCVCSYNYTNSNRGNSSKHATYQAQEFERSYKQRMPPSNVHQCGCQSTSC